MKKLDFAVVTETTLCYINSDKKYVEEKLPFTSFTTIAQLFQLAYDKGLTKLWVHLPIAMQKNLTDDYLNCEEDICTVLKFRDEKTGEYVKPSFKKIAYFEGNIKKTGEYTPNVGIGFLANEWSDYGGSALYEDHTGKDVYTAFYYLESLLSVECSYSTGYTGQQLIKHKLHKSHNEHVLQPQQDMNIFKSISGYNNLFNRPITKEEAKRKYVIQIDKNSDFLASANINLGVREYLEIDKPTFNKNAVGLWYVRIEGSSKFDGNLLPYPCRILADGKKEGWLYTPTLHLLMDLEYEISIEKGLLWPYASTTDYYNGTYSRILESWANELKQAYEDMRVPLARFKNKESLEIAKESLKTVYSKALSGLSHEKVRKNDIHRPDWYHSIIATSSSRMFRNMDDFTEDGLYPFMYNRDALFYCVDSSKLEEVFRTKPLRTGKKVGHYKLVYCLPMTLCRHILIQDMPYYKKSSELKKIHKQIEKERGN